MSFDSPHPRVSYLILSLLGFGPQLWAANQCHVLEVGQGGYRLECPDSELRTVVGNSIPTIGDALGINPATLPVRPSPFGVEVLANAWGGDGSLGIDAEFAIIRGFRGFGAGFISDPDNSFYSNTFVSNALAESSDGETETTESSGFQIPNLAFGVATALTSRLTLGTSLKFSQENSSSGYSVGLAIPGRSFTGGISYQVEPKNSLDIEERGITLNLGASYKSLDLDGVYKVTTISSDSTEAYLSIYSLTATLHLRRWILSAAIKEARIHQSASTESASQKSVMGALIFQAFKRFRLVYLYNYRPGAHSAGIQALLF